MKLYWFADEEGSFWQVIAANDNDRAWEILAQISYSNGPSSTEPGISVSEAQEKYVLNATTEVTATEGEVATIFPHEVNFSIKRSFGDKKQGHLRNI